MLPERLSRTKRAGFYRPPPGPAIIVHGGAGDWSAEDGDGQAPLAGCGAAARAGYEMLARGGSALEAAAAAVVVLEDDPQFNAGTGSALTADGEVECDASVMCGDGRAGAVGALGDVKNPIAVARLVMERTPHVLLVGAGAVDFAIESGLPPLPPETLVTDRMRGKWRAALARAAAAPSGGTVGCVARDAAGRVAAATSTGGMMLKRRGRVGDSAVIGAGNLRRRRRRRGLLHRRRARLSSRQPPPSRWSRRCAPAGRRRRPRASCCRRSAATAARGGLICVDAAGRVGLAFDTPRMAHAWIDAHGRAGGGFILRG